MNINQMVFGTFNHERRVKMTEFIGTVVAGLVVLIVLLVPVYFLESAACNAKFAGYGKTSYGFIQGCMIATNDGRNVPAQAIRELDE
jgi:hypothetical protein